MRSPRALYLTAILTAALHWSCLLTPDDERAGTRVSNQRPSVRITAGATTSDTTGVDYKVNFRWNGTDTDGVVTRFEYAVDDTVSENAWSRTAEFSRDFLFEASLPDPNDSSGVRFSQWHTLHLRGVDNEGAVSPPVRQFFNARTVAPTSYIARPTGLGPRPSLQQTFIVEWGGEDLDSSEPGKEPIAWEYKLVYVGNIVVDPAEAFVDSLHRANNLFLDGAGLRDQTSWVRVPGDIRNVRINNLSPGRYLAFGVRAVDEAGVIEPELEIGRNMLAFSVSGEPSEPYVTMNESTVGSHFFDGSSAWEISVPSGRPLYFTWTGDADYYGSAIGNWNYAIDIPDPDDDSINAPRGYGGWIGWGDWRGLAEPLVFGSDQSNMTHHLWVKVRDLSNSVESERLCEVRIKVVPFTFERLVLVVDDAKFVQAQITDQIHDDFMSNVMLRRFKDFATADHYAAWGPREGGFPSGANNLTLERIAQYQHVVWQTQHLSTSSVSALDIVENQKGLLSSYLAAGGRLMMIGGQLSSLLNDRGFEYPKNGPDSDEKRIHFGFDNFIYTFMRMRNEIVSVATEGPDSAPAKREASGLIGLRSTNPSFPDIRIDRMKRDPWEPVNKGQNFRGGIIDWEGFRDQRNPVAQAGMDSLYTPVTMDSTLRTGRVNAGFQDAVVGWRYQATAADTARGTQQGRTVVLNFQPYWFEENPIRDAGTTAINWLMTGQDH